MFDANYILTHKAKIKLLYAKKIKVNTRITIMTGT